MPNSQTEDIRKLPVTKEEWETLVQKTRFFTHKYIEPDLSEFIFYLFLKMQMLHDHIWLEKEDWRYLCDSASFFHNQYEDEGLRQFLKELFEIIERLYDKIGGK